MTISVTRIQYLMLSTAALCLCYNSTEMSTWQYGIKYVSDQFPIWLRDSYWIYNAKLVPSESNLLSLISRIQL